MTITLTRPRGSTATAAEGRFRLARAGILNVWQYDDQEFAFAGGRMLLRGANGAGKSKTLEMLLPFVLDGDKTRITASARHHTSLLWLMTDGYDGQNRTGYLWVELTRTGAGGEEAYTCGVGIRASSSARSATAWFFVTDQRVGLDLALEDEAGPLSRPRLVEAIGERGQVFEQARAYKEHVGRTLFGLDATQYDEVLRLLYWLRQPQIGEDIEPARLAGQLSQALPQLDEHSVRAAGDTFDELAAYGEQIERRAAAAESLGGLAAAYARYARGVVAARGAAVLAAVKEARRLLGELRRNERETEALAELRERTGAELTAAAEAERREQARIRELEASPEARDQRRVSDLAERAEERASEATRAERHASGLGDRLARNERVLADDAEQVAHRSRQQAGRVGQVASGLAGAGVGTTLLPPPTPAGEAVADAEEARRLVAGFEQHADGLDATGAAVTARLAAVEVVREAASAHERAAREAQQEERRAAEAERRWEESRGRRVAAESEADREASRVEAAFRAWTEEPAAAGLTLPTGLTSGLPTMLEAPAPGAGEGEPGSAGGVAGLDALPRLAKEAAEPVLGRLRAEQQAAASERDRAAAEIAALEDRRAAIVAERDPAPPAPALPRTARPDGAPLWRCLDFGADLEASARALLEAALQDSGLLDAWVRPDGAVLDADHRDVVLPAGPALAGPTLADVLVPACPDDAGLLPEVVAGVLRRVGLDPVRSGPAGPAGSGPTAADAAWVAVDGSWAMGPLRGRAAKDAAQYVGATARAAERRRRLAEVDAALATAREREQLAAARSAELADRIRGVEAWLARIPSTRDLVRAWQRVEVLAEAVIRDEAHHRESQRAAHEARSEAAARRRELTDLARQHGVPLEPAGIDALRERLRGLAEAVKELRLGVPALLRDLAGFATRRDELDDDAAAVAAAAEEGTRRRAAAEEASAAHRALLESVGAGVRELQERVDASRRAVAEQQHRQRTLHDRLLQVERDYGRVEGAVRRAGEAVADHEAVRAAALVGLGELGEVPGLLEAAAGSEARAGVAAGVVAAGEAAAGEVAAGEVAGLRAALAQAATVGAGDQVPKATLDAAARLAELGDTGTGSAPGSATPNAVWQSYQEAASGPAADHEPRVISVGEVLAVTARDDAGEDPIAVIAPRLAARVEQDRGLLTDRERDQFERHVLGELGDAIRRCQLEADELVHAMNELLAGVTTSQGIRVRLDWRLRDDVPPDAARAVTLLTQPIGALLPEERLALRDALHRLIEASRAERPELSYGEHLAAALDYRSWFGFRIRYTRPESGGSWLDLHRRSPLSQGEQKVLCYLPLFAAAAAHFSSLAGAAPHAPRLILLDDAFPKIDVRTHPLLFGLLVQLDLDFVVTSERLWGDHDTVPSLAIYEALRDPMQRGIAQYEYRWDGRQLRAIG